MTRAAINAADELVERMGLHWEQDGLPRIAGRIFGRLLLEPEPCSLDDLAAALGVSKASVSVDARRLERLGLITRVSRPGDRRDYYAIGENILAHAIEMKLDRMRRLQDVFLAARRVPDAPPRVRKRLTDMARQHERVLRSMQILLDELRVASADAGVPSE